MSEERERAEATQWKQDCIKWRGCVLTGRYAHYCWDWDGLPVDETTVEFISDSCFPKSKEITEIQEKLRLEFEARELECRNRESMENKGGN